MNHLRFKESSKGNCIRDVEHCEASYYKPAGGNGSQQSVSLVCNTKSNQFRKQLLPYTNIFIFLFDKLYNKPCGLANNNNFNKITRNKYSCRLSNACQGGMHKRSSPLQRTVWEILRTLLTQYLTPPLLVEQ